MDSPQKTTKPIEATARTSNMSDRRKLLASIEEEYYQTNQSFPADRWQHTLRRAILARRIKQS